MYTHHLGAGCTGRWNIRGLPVAQERDPPEVDGWRMKPYVGQLQITLRVSYENRSQWAKSLWRFPLPSCRGPDACLSPIRSVGRPFAGPCRPPACCNPSCRGATFSTHPWCQARNALACGRDIQALAVRDAALASASPPFPEIVCRDFRRNPRPMRSPPLQAAPSRTAPTAARTAHPAS